MRNINQECEIRRVQSQKELLKVLSKKREGVKLPDDLLDQLDQALHPRIGVLDGLVVFQAVPNAASDPKEQVGELSEQVGEAFAEPRQVAECLLSRIDFGR